MEDLWQFNEEEVVRAIYESEIPVIAAVGHDKDITLTNYVSDVVGSTPSAAAELAVPDIFEIKEKLKLYRAKVTAVITNIINNKKMVLDNYTYQIEKNSPKMQLENKKIMIDMLKEKISVNILNIVTVKKHEFEKNVSKLESLNPLKILSRGYLVSEKEGKMIKTVKDLKKGEKITLKYHDGTKEAEIL